jgi:hypothetical protein
MACPEKSLLVVLLLMRAQVVVDGKAVAGGDEGATVGATVGVFVGALVGARVGVLTHRQNE